MSEVNEPYAPGIPCWVDLTVADQRAALDFYRDLFGWSGEFVPPETGGYSICTLGGKAVAGIGSARTAEGEPAPPPGWNTYLASADADATARAVIENGGTALMPVMDITDAGRFLVAADPTGAMFHVWQAAEFFGAQRVNEPGSVVWNELNTQDPDTAAAFYRDVFGMGSTRMEQAPGYFSLTVAGRPVGGMQAVAADSPLGGASRWLVYFAVDDVDSTVDALVRADGTVLRPPFDMVAGRMAVLQDPQGGTFAVIAAEPTPA
jgi:Predicted enzyme related to lactoylglutathione lyase